MNSSPRTRRARALKAAALLLPAVLVFCAAACSPKPAAEQKRYDLKGRVVAVDRAKGEATVEHEDIPGYMPSMTMDFPVRDKEALKVMEPGDRVQGSLVVTDDAYWLDAPVITKGQPGDAAASPPPGAREPKVGDPLPDVKLVNQDGRPVGARDQKGRAVVVTFIYTRCPIPDYCPLMSANFAQLNAALLADPELRRRARLLSVTLDPEHDRPAVLKGYGATYAGGKFDNWDFATGDAAEVRRLAEFFGLTYKAEGEQIIHSLRTAVVAPDGRLLKLYRGNEWKPDEVLNDLRGLPAS